MTLIKDRRLSRIFIFVLAAAILLPAVDLFIIIPIYKNLVLRNIEDEASRTTAHISRMFFPDGETALPVDIIQEKMAAEVKQLAEDFLLMKIKVFDPDGTVIFSTDAADIGTVNTQDYFHNEVARGRIFSKIVHRDEKSLEGQEMISDVVETYVPIIRDSSFVGAFELYYDITAKNAALRRAQLLSSALPILFAILFAVIAIIFLVRFDRALTRRKLDEETLRELAASLEFANEEIATNHQKLQGAFEQISSLIQEVSTTQNVKLRYKNPRLVRCYQIKNCQQKDCPCYGIDPMRCWQKAGTFCGGRVQGAFAQKISTCKDCEVFSKASSDPADIIGEHFNNMMHILEVSQLDLRESEERFRALTETASDAIVSTDSNGTIIYWNKAAEELFGFTSGEITGKEITLIIPERLREPHQRAMARYLASGKSTAMGRSLELTGLRKDGSEFPLELSLATWKRGKKVFFTAIIRNITERKEIADRLKQDKEDLEKLATDLEKANQELKATQAQMLQREKMASIGQLAAGIAHEINNPMGFITGNLRALQKYVTKYVDFIHFQEEILDAANKGEETREAREKLKLDFLIEDTKGLIAESLDGVKRVSEIVQNLKNFSRVDAATMGLADINKCLDSTLMIIDKELRDKATVHKEYGELSQTFCNPQELNQLFLNLLTNASHAIGNRGDITIQTREKQGVITIAISDNGAGIPTDVIGRIFEPFFTTKPVGQGTGLGLSLCYDIVKKHGGEISVASEPGKGTAFTITLPVKKGDEVGAHTSDA